MAMNAMKIQNEEFHVQVMFSNACLSKLWISRNVAVPNPMRIGSRMREGRKVRNNFLLSNSMHWDD
jgi:hypothetical protein